MTSYVPKQLDHTRFDVYESKLGRLALPNSLREIETSGNLSFVLFSHPRNDIEWIYCPIRTACVTKHEGEDTDGPYSLDKRPPSPPVAGHASFSYEAAFMYSIGSGPATISWERNTSHPQLEYRLEDDRNAIMVFARESEIVTATDMCYKNPRYGVLVHFQERLHYVSVGDCQDDIAVYCSRQNVNLAAANVDPITLHRIVPMSVESFRGSGVEIEMYFPTLGKYARLSCLGLHAPYVMMGRKKEELAEVSEFVVAENTIVGESVLATPTKQ